jgi:hypothetical protein
MKRTLLFMACVLASLTMSAQENSYFDYVPFVKEGKKWHMVHTEFGTNFHRDQYVLRNENVTKTGKTYMTMYRTEDVFTVIYDEGALHEVGLYREEDCKVYFFDDDMQKEYLLFDYSLKAGDTYETYSYDEQKAVTYKVLSVGDYTEGPEVIRYTQDADSMRAEYRYLRKWTVCRADDNSLQKTWIEGVGSLEGPLAYLYDARPVYSRDYLAYVEFPDDYRFDNPYLPFSFYDTMNKQIHGSNLPKTASYIPGDWQSQLTYELEGDRLHVYGQIVLNCGCYNYAYFTEEPTDDPLVHKLRFEIQDVGIEATCVSLFATDFYVPGFDPTLNYIVVDNQGEEHPVINKTPQMAYRPFTEDGKVWVVKVYPDGFGTVRDDTWTDYCYFDGDSIINGHTCKQMKYVTNATEDNWVNGVFTPGNLTQHYIGAFYEQDRKVYYANKQIFEQLYDFTLSTNDSITMPDGAILVVNKASGGIPGFKGTYYDLYDYDYAIERWLEGVGSESWPWNNHPRWQNGHVGMLLACIIGDEVIYNYSTEDDPYIINAPKGRFDFTHIVKDKPKAPKMRGNETSLYGEYNEHQLGINLDPIDDAYLVRIINESGKLVYEKAINAGNIVALNIDISAYPIGCYTVTIENSSESFTGEFDTQTAGISDALRLNKKEEINNNIYNLQGQRINSLQKGLNIVNGKIVNVK